jgi:hypothetical protein
MHVEVADAERVDAEPPAVGVAGPGSRQAAAQEDQDSSGRRPAPRMNMNRAVWKPRPGAGRGSGAGPIATIGGGGEYRSPPRGRGQLPESSDRAIRPPPRTTSPR